jgi:predicted nucleic acid-binding protein
VICLVDTSALAKLVAVEPESAALKAYLHAATGDQFVISTLALVELRRFATRVGLHPTLPMAAAERFDVLALTEPMLHLAGTFPQANLGTLDAIHLATAVIVGADTLVTYDSRQGDAAAQEGLNVEAPA